MSAIPFSFRRFFLAMGAYGLLVLVGTVGFQLLLDERLSTALYRTVVTTTLTGEIRQPETVAGEMFSIVVLLGGVAIFLYLATAIAEMIARGVLGDNLAERRRKRTIDQIEDHVIICGFGRVGRRVAAEIQRSGRGYLVLDVNEESIAAAAALGAPVLHGDGTDDGDLERAGVLRARALVASADSDQVNLYITLSARALCNDLFIVARASDESAARKLARAGANRVVQPYSTAGLHIANSVLKPQVAEFLDIVTTSEGPMPDLRIEEIVVTEACGHCGKSIGDLRIREFTGGALIVAVRKQQGALEITPSPDVVVDEGDVLIGVGTIDEIERLEELFAPRGTSLA